jgi:transposase
MSRDVISDRAWSVVEPLMPLHRISGGRRRHDDRAFLEAVAWKYRTVGLLPAKIWVSHPEVIPVRGLPAAVPFLVTGAT